MKRFRVIVQTEKNRCRYDALGRSSAAVHADAQRRFGGLSGVTVIPVSKNG